ncbi:rhomboid family intramembrane serine protease [Bacteroidota bacterium]
MGYDNRDYYRPSGFRGFSFFPPVIKYILIINGIAFFLQVIFENLNFGGLPGWYVLNRFFALNPIVGFDQAGQPYNFQIWQLITYQFMHGDFFHILFNMFMLWMFGMEIENIMGKRKFLFFYLFSGFIAGLCQILLGPVLSNSAAFTIGASGAVFGVMVAFAMYFPDRYIYVYFLLPVKAKYLIAFIVVFEFLSVGQMSFVAHLAHIGGAVTGFIFILLDRKYNFNFNKLFTGAPKPSFRERKDFNFRSSFRKKPIKERDIEEADFIDINDSKSEMGDKITQEEIDKILDKISESGYQNLTEREKRILFEASKRNIHEK